MVGTLGFMVMAKGSGVCRIIGVKTFSAAGRILAPKNLAGRSQHRILVTARSQWQKACFPFCAELTTGGHFAISRAALQCKFLDPRRATIHDVAGRIWPAGRIFYTTDLDLLLFDPILQ